MEMNENLNVLKQILEKKNDKLQKLQKKYSLEKEKREELEVVCGIIDTMYLKLKEDNRTLKQIKKVLENKKLGDFKYLLNKIIAGCMYESTHEGSVCSICQCSFTDPKEITIVLNCFHCYHNQCIKGCLDTTKKCPECGNDLENTHTYNK